MLGDAMLEARFAAELDGTLAELRSKIQDLHLREVDALRHDMQCLQVELDSSEPLAPVVPSALERPISPMASHAVQLLSPRQPVAMTRKQHTSVTKAQDIALAIDAEGGAEDIHPLLLNLGDLFRGCVSGNPSARQSGPTAGPAPAVISPTIPMPAAPLRHDSGLAALVTELHAWKSGLEDTMLRHKESIDNHHRFLAESLQHVAIQEEPLLQEASELPFVMGFGHHTPPVKKLATVAEKLQQQEKRWIPRPKNPRGRLAEVVSSDAFAVAISIVIVLNTIFIGMRTEWGIKNAVREERRDEPLLFDILDRFFLTAFTVELLLKLVGLRFAFFLGPDWHWNMFDLVCVCFAFPERFASWFNVSFLRVVRMVRMFRVARIIRVLRFFRELRLMVCAMAASMTSLMWAFFLLGMIMYVFAILFTQAVADYLEQKGPPLDEDMVKWYGSLMDTIYTLLLTISGGWSWYELVDPLGRIHSGYFVMFIVYTLFVIFGMMNVLTGVFVGRASEIGQLDRDLVVQAEEYRIDQFYRDMKELYLEYDTDSDGAVTWESFRDFMDTRDDVQTYFATIGVDVSEVKELFQLLDLDEGGSVSIEEFAFGLHRVKGEAKNLDVLRLAKRVEILNKNLEDLLPLVRRQSLRRGTTPCKVSASPGLTQVGATKKGSMAEAVNRAAQHENGFSSSV